MSAKGRNGTAELFKINADEKDGRIPAAARLSLDVLARQHAAIAAEIGTIEQRIHAWHRSSEESRRLEPTPGTDIRIVDEQMKEVPRGQTGEVVARGPSVMLGYWRKPEQTEAAIINGWLRTGDAGYMDEEGFMVDRVKDMIVSGGENVYSAEVETRWRSIRQCWSAW